MNDVDELLSKWYDLKETINKLETKMKEYKLVAEQLMSKNNTTELKNKEYVLEKKELTRRTVNKEQLPVEIWNKYSKEQVYNSFYISKVGEKKRSRRRSRSRKK